MALRLSNGRWALFDRDERRVGRATYGSPADVAAAHDAREASDAT